LFSQIFRLSLKNGGLVMFRKVFLMPTVLSLACLLMAADFAQAQRRGRGWGGGRGNYGNYYDAYRGYNNSWGSWSWGGMNFNIGPSTPYGSSYYDYGTSPYRSYYYDQPYRSYYYEQPYRSYYYEQPSYYQPAPRAVEQPATVVTSRANIRVMVPTPQARVWFDGAQTSQTGTDRLFQTPSLTSQGTYRIRAAWMQNGQEMTQERVVNVSPGQNVLVDFNQ
jgi:uncharacterized protein (TIGR03000 family)